MALWTMEVETHQPPYGPSRGEMTGLSRLPAERLTLTPERRQALREAFVEAVCLRYEAFRLHVIRCALPGGPALGVDILERLDYGEPLRAAATAPTPGWGPHSWEIGLHLRCTVDGVTYSATAERGLWRVRMVEAGEG